MTSKACVRNSTAWRQANDRILRATPRLSTPGRNAVLPCCVPDRGVRHRVVGIAALSGGAARPPILRELAGRFSPDYRRSELGRSAGEWRPAGGAFARARTFGA